MTIEEMQFVIAALQDACDVPRYSGHPRQELALAICEKALEEELEMQRLESACPTCGADGGTTCGAVNCGH